MTAPVSLRCGTSLAGRTVGETVITNNGTGDSTVTRTYRRGLLLATLVCGLFSGIGASVQASGAWLGDCCGESSSCCDDVCCDDPCVTQCDCGNVGCDSLACCDAAGCAESCLPKLDSFAQKLGCGGCIQKSDQCFDDFISPMIDFVHFEDPRNVTELRPIFAHHRFPNQLGPGGVPAGGSLQLFALQFRIALTERLSLIAVKDGYVIDSSEGALDGLLDSGWADVTAGLKYNLVRNVKTGTLLSAGFTYEIPMGSEQTLQSVGDGEFHFFATGGQRLFDGNAHVLSSFGWQLPVDQSVQSTTVHWNNHIDVRCHDKVYLFTENAWWHWTDDADTGSAFGVSGLDLLNLGDTAVEGNDVVTQNVGMKLKPKRNMELGMAYEFPLTDFEDIIRDRWTFDAIVRY
ncbi:hypothetical protein [Aporhodopirellula aestuarii]|uniref:Uncharacterized protein n=1 Tax=Aporhodopirellula aestuarii TaxID=2950107 RepID=A0ABT0U522_9BACT|nr:hypothetical protein [Aporhodopirellula aestuarii]MCM2372020.1 hypothetical protein [Aporhodopirellula aestuarii]